MDWDPGIEYFNALRRIDDVAVFDALLDGGIPTHRGSRAGHHPGAGAGTLGPIIVARRGPARACGQRPCPQYRGENHGLAKPANQKDYTLRMREFFDHYLRDRPARRWLTEGVPHLKLEEHLQERLSQNAEE